MVPMICVSESNPAMYTGHILLTTYPTAKPPPGVAIPDDEVLRWEVVHPTYFKSRVPRGGFSVEEPCVYHEGDRPRGENGEALPFEWERFPGFRTVLKDQEERPADNRECLSQYHRQQSATDNESKSYPDTTALPSRSLQEHCSLYHGACMMRMLTDIKRYYTRNERIRIR